MFRMIIMSKHVSFSYIFILNKIEIKTILILCHKKLKISAIYCVTYGTYQFYYIEDFKNIKHTSDFMGIVRMNFVYLIKNNLTALQSNIVLIIF